MQTDSEKRENKSKSSASRRALRLALVNLLCAVALARICFDDGLSPFGPAFLGAVAIAGGNAHLTLLGVLPQDEAVYRCDCAGEPSAKLPESDPMRQALNGIMRTIGL